MLAVIPARAGSQGLRGKNFKVIAGKPLIFWSIDAALDCKFIDTVVVSTNDAHINSIVKAAYRNEPRLVIIKRPDDLCTPTSKTEEALVHAVEKLQKKKQTYDIVCLLQPTSPARQNNLVSKCLKEMIGQNRDSVMTVSKSTPFFWKYKNDKDVTPTYSIVNRPMRQELKKTDFYFHDNGNLYACLSSLLLSDNPRRVGDNPVLVETSFFESLQIDTLNDFRTMEALSNIYGGFL